MCNCLCIVQAMEHLSSAGPDALVSPVDGVFTPVLVLQSQVQPGEAWESGMLWNALLYRNFHRVLAESHGWSMIRLCPYNGVHSCTFPSMTQWGCLLCDPPSEAMSLD